MEINITGLRTILNDFNHIAVYGCGDFAGKTYEILNIINIQPDFFVVTQKRNNQVFYGESIPIYEVKEQVENIINNNIMILIAVSDRYTNEVIDVLKAYGIKKYISITDFIKSSSDYLKYNCITEQECIRKIAEWHLDYIADYKTDIDIEIHNINMIIKNANRNDKKIMFVLGALTPRTVKIADSLLDRGYEIEMLAEPRAIMQKICVNELDILNITCIECKTIEELMYRMIVGKSKTIHLFTQRGNSHFDKILIKMKSLFSPIIYDEYDIISIGYNNVRQDIMDNERYCLEHADGICNRGYEIDYLKENCGFDIIAKSIQFPDYCSNIQCDSIINDKNDLSVCYSGGIISKSEYSDWFETFEELAGQCAMNKCHFHIYPHTWNEEYLKDYMEMEYKNEYFHVHKPVPHEILSKEISKYDYGILPIRRQSLEKGVAYNTREKNVYAATNKFFDYLDAGLPIITPCPLKLVDFLNEKGVVIKWCIEDFNFEELRQIKKEMKEKVMIERKELQIRNHINELIALYNAI